VTTAREQIEQYDVVGAAEDADLHAIARIAAHICGARSAMVNLLTESEQHTVAGENFALGTARRDDSMCATTLRLAHAVHVPDATTDDRFAANPFVTGELGSIRFYAASLLTTPSGTTVGTLCVSDEVPHELEPSQRAALDALADQAVQVLSMRGQQRALTRSNAELTRSNADLGQFTGRVAHDLRNPITAIKGFLDLAQGAFGAELSGRARECVEYAAEATDRMADLVNGLLAFAAVGGQPRREEVPLGEVVASVVQDVTGLLKDTGGRIDVGELPTVATDPTLVRQLLQNLVSNGLKYSRPGVAPVVQVQGTAGDDGWSLSVTDNGRGIPTEDREAVFELFVRLPGGRDEAGSGIGLATCARITDALGGRLTLSDAPDGGTTVLLEVQTGV
jgi:signal transduction histidine kinase